MPKNLDKKRNDILYILEFITNGRKFVLKVPVE